MRPRTCAPALRDLISASSLIQPAPACPGLPRPAPPACVPPASATWPPRLGPASRPRQPSPPAAPCHPRPLRLTPLGRCPANHPAHQDTARRPPYRRPARRTRLTPPPRRTRCVIAHAGPLRQNAAPTSPAIPFRPLHPPPYRSLHRSPPTRSTAPTRRRKLLHRTTARPRCPPALPARAARPCRPPVSPARVARPCRPHGRYAPFRCCLVLAPCHRHTARPAVRKPWDRTRGTRWTCCAVLRHPPPQAAAPNHCPPVLPARAARPRRPHVSPAWSLRPVLTLPRPGALPSAYGPPRRPQTLGPHALDVLSRAGSLAVLSAPRRPAVLPAPPRRAACAAPPCCLRRVTAGVLRAARCTAALSALRRGAVLSVPHRPCCLRRVVWPCCPRSAAAPCCPRRLDPPCCPRRAVCRASAPRCPPCSLRRIAPAVLSGRRVPRRAVRAMRRCRAVRGASPGHTARGASLRRAVCAMRSAVLSVARCPAVLSANL